MSNSSVPMKPNSINIRPICVLDSATELDVVVVSAEANSNMASEGTQIPPQLPDGHHSKLSSLLFAGEGEGDASGGHTGHGSGVGGTGHGSVDEGTAFGSGVGGIGCGAGHGTGSGATGHGTGGGHTKGLGTGCSTGTGPCG